MILYGRDLSSFVRRVAVWCAIYGLPVERRQLAATDPADADAIRAVHPGLRVPALELDDATVLIDSAAICDWLDEQAGEARLVPAAGRARRDCLQRIALAQATCEKGVALVYEKNRRPAELHWPEWQARIAGQIRGGLAALDAAAPEDGWWGGDRPDGSDLMAPICWQFIESTNPGVLDPGYPRFAALVERAMAVPALAATDPRP